MNLRHKLSLLCAGLLAVVGSAQAALPAEASTALASIGTAITDMETGVWPYVGAATVAVILIKLFKRFSNKV